VAGAGLSRIGAPTAMAGATLCAARLSGKLNGEMPSTAPLAKRRTIAARPAAAASVSSRCSSPPKRLASSAAQRKTETARPTSALAHLIGLPFSAVISSAISSDRSASRRDTWSSAAARALTGREPATGTAACAAATASSTCASVGIETSAITSPVYLFVTENEPAPVAGRPASQKLRGTVNARESDSVVDTGHSLGTAAVSLATLVPRTRRVALHSAA
jgi:hypothetical protein